MFIHKHRNQLNTEILIHFIVLLEKICILQFKILHFTFIFKLNHCTTALICISTHSASNRIRHKIIFYCNRTFFYYIN